MSRRPGAVEDRPAGDAPLFSVLCPTYNRSARLLPTLRSVLAQRLADFELLVLDDGSTDDTVRVAESTGDPRVRVVRARRTGHPSGPRQQGLALARGRWIAYLDHDDSWRPDHLDALHQLLDQGAPLAVTGYRAVDEEGRTTRESGWWDLCWHPELQYLDPLFEPSRFAHRRGLAESVGGWRVTPGLEDWDLLVRLTEAGHHPRTTTARTVSVFESTATRRHRLAPGHFAPLLHTTDARLARRVRDALDAPDTRRLLDAAARQDSRARIQRLGATPDFVRPLATPEVPEPGEIPPESGRGPEPLIVPRGGGYLLAVPVFLSTPEHAARFDALLTEHAAAQLALLRRLESELAGQPRTRHREPERTAGEAAVRHEPVAPRREPAP
ncbi:glycosyltransferase family 2 protein [Streptomyces physcomitrii]|uniref:Glycosyltransferase family 2 protein n=1 Tax=Streptomyces physcomitrii TaxID=2724184 RepID=A0ABX1GXK3_9ACTN|nr:glycosyltransferase family A protein [Streptomyces physcomitrii]NKI40836.1 glycosyltransferase family 2 protein [Streptomyces physcomitrii]